MLRRYGEQALRDVRPPNHSMHHIQNGLPRGLCRTFVIYYKIGLRTSTTVNVFGYARAYLIGVSSSTMKAPLSRKVCMHNVILSLIRALTGVQGTNACGHSPSQRDGRYVSAIHCDGVITNLNRIRRKPSFRAVSKSSLVSRYRTLQRRHSALKTRPSLPLSRNPSRSLPHNSSHSQRPRKSLYTHSSLARRSSYETNGLVSST